MDKVVQDLITSQSEVITILALRISVLEKLLLEKKIITDDEVLKETNILANEFVSKTNEALKIAESKVNK